MNGKAKDLAVLKAAHARALAGDCEGARAAFEPLAAAGSTVASAALAQLAAYRFDWPEVLRHASAFFEDTSQVSASNIFEDLVRLLGAAGRRGQPWSEISVVAKKAAKATPKNQTDTLKILERLDDYAKREGKGDQELIAIFETNNAPPKHENYVVAMAKHEAEKKKKKPEVWAQRAFSLANAFREDDEMLRLFDAHAKHLGFAAAVDAARVAGRRGDLERAWRLIEPKLGGFWPIDLAQVLPVILIGDPAFAAMIDEKRAAKICKTPRGSKA